MAYGDKSKYSNECEVKMDRHEFEEKWGKSDGIPHFKRMVCIGNNGLYVVADDYSFYKNIIHLYVDSIDGRNDRFWEYALEDISDVMEY